MNLIVSVPVMRSLGLRVFPTPCANRPNSLASPRFHTALSGPCNRFGKDMAVVCRSGAGLDGFGVSVAACASWG